jgi:hypothetical protein
MTVKAASGETVLVDLARLSPNVQELVVQGERVTVLGVMGPQSDVLTAQGVVARGRTVPESGSALPRDAARPGQVPDAVERAR